MTEYDAQRIQKHINDIQKRYNSIIRTIQSSNIKYNLLNAQSNLDKYSRMASDAKKHTDKVIEEAIKGSGFIFRTEGFKDYISCKNKDVSKEITNTLDSYDREISLMITRLDSLSRKFSNTDLYNKNIDSKRDDDNIKNNIYLDVYEHYTNKSFDDKIKNEAIEEVISPISEQKIAKSFPIVGLDEVGKKQKTKVIEKQKKMVITKQTVLDTDELKELFLSRHADYSLTIEHLNKSIDIVGNNVDKDLILLEALQIRFYEYITTFDYFYCYTTIKKAIPLALRLGKYDIALEFIFVIVCLETSGYLMAHAKYMERKNIDDVLVDPRLTEKFIEEIKTKKIKTNNELYELYVNSSFVNKLIMSMPNPLFSLENSAKIMLMVYENPKNYYKCNELGLTYNK